MEIGKINVGGIDLSYQKQGQGGTTLVLLHGNSGCKDVFENQFYHFEGSTYTVLALDLPGHGASDNALSPESTYTIPGYAQLINKALDALEIGEHIIVGWSLGGNIALEMAGTDLATPNPAFKGIMIFGAPPVGPGMENLDKAYLPATFESAVGDDDTSSQQIDAFVKAIYGTLKPIPKTFYQCAHRTEGKAREIMVGHWMGGNDGHKQYETIASWTKPISVVHGNLDPFVALDYLKHAPWKNLWRGKVFELPDVGHAPFVEDPATFNMLLELFAADTLSGD